MKVFPAIDIRNGQAVRLTQGDYSLMQVYSQNPLEFAEKFARSGASNLHLVDLDGAKDGKPVNKQLIREIVSESKMFIELGGGIRNERQIAEYLELGIGRVILGTIAVQDFKFTEKMIDKYGRQIAVGVDAKQGKVATCGWLESTALDSLEFCQRLASVGLQTIIYTDISKDGALGGTNLDIYKSLSEIKIDIIASGGVTYLDEIVKLKEFGTAGVILGKALYEGKINLSEAVATAEKR